MWQVHHTSTFSMTDIDDNQQCEYDNLLFDVELVSVNLYVPSGLESDEADYLAHKADNSQGCSSLSSNEYQSDMPESGEEDDGGWVSGNGSGEEEEFEGSREEDESESSREEDGPEVSEPEGSEYAEEEHPHSSTG